MKLLVKNNFLHTDKDKFRCSVGLNGLRKDKTEGDLCTPIGTFNIIKIYYRPDKLGKLKFNIPASPILENDGWCDDPQSEFYNQHIKFPFNKSAEKLFRNDDLYDILCVLDYNTNPILPGKGSAIFLHVSRPNYAGTEGCIAMGRSAIIQIAQIIPPNTTITIKN